MFLLAALLLTVDAPAPQEDALRILVVQGGPLETRSARAEAVYAGLRAAGLLSVEAEERAGVDRPAPPPFIPGVRDTARAELQEARARFRELDLDATRAAIDATVDELVRLDRPEDALDTFIDALLLRANVALQAGVDDDARAALTLVARLDPGREELHPGLYPPSLCEAFLAARATSQEAPVAALAVHPRVAGFGAAQVLVDGRPWSGEPVRAGPHLVVARAAGAVTFARLLTLSAQEPTALTPFLAPADVTARRAALNDSALHAADDDARARALGALAQLCAARAVLYLGGENAALWSARGLDVVPAPSTANGATLGRATLATLQAPARAERGLPPAGASDPTLLIVGGSVGAVVIAASVAVGLWALLPASPPAPPPRPVTVTCCVD